MKNIFNPFNFEYFFFRRFCMGIGGSSKSSSTTNLDTSTKVTTTNQQVGASEGSAAFGANSNVNYNVTNEDPKTLRHIADVNRDVSVVAISQVGSTAKDALNFGDSALNTVGRTVEQANELLSRSFESYAGKLKDNSGVAPSTVAISSSQQTTMVIIAVAIVAAVLGYSILKK